MDKDQLDQLDNVSVSEDVEKEVAENETKPELEIVSKDDREISEDTNTDEEKNSQSETESLSDRAKVLSPGRLVVKRFFRSKLSIVGLVMLIALFFFSFIGPFFSPYGELDKDNSPGDTIFLSSFHTGNMTDEEGNKTGEEYSYYLVSMTQKSVNMYAMPSAKHWLGTDQLAMDVFTRVMYGGRISLLLSFVTIFVETILGVILGGLSGYFGKWVDQLIMRIVDIIYCLPQMPVMLIAGAAIDGWVIKELIPDSMRIFALMLILTLMGWAGVARLVRGQILMLREQEYMIAAEATGLSTTRKIFKHLLPNVLPQLIVSMTLGLGGIILTESTLSYLGLGVQYPNAAWGTMIGLAKNPDVMSYYPNQWLLPGVCIIIATLGFNFVGDGLRDAFDPKMKR